MQSRSTGAHVASRLRSGESPVAESSSGDTSHAAPLASRSRRDKRVVAGIYASFRLLGSGDTVPCFQDGEQRACLHKVRDPCRVEVEGRQDLARLLLSIDGLRVPELRCLLEDPAHQSEFDDADSRTVALAVDSGYFQSVEIFMTDLTDAKPGARRFFMNWLIPQPGDPNPRRSTAEHVQAPFCACLRADWRWGIEFFMDCVRECVALAPSWPVVRQRAQMDETHYGMKCVLMAAAAASDQSLHHMERFAREFHVDSFAQFGCGCMDSVLSTASLEALEWLAARGATASKVALESGRMDTSALPVYEWLWRHVYVERLCMSRNRGPKSFVNTQMGPEVLQWLFNVYQLEMNTLCRESLADRVLQAGGVVACEWLHTKGAFDPLRLGHIMRTAAESANLPVMRWLRATFPTAVVPQGVEVSQLMRMGSRDTIAWLCEECAFVPSDSNLCTLIGAGRLDALEYLQTSGTSNFNHADFHSSVPPVQWSARARTLSGALFATCMSGNLDVAEWLHESQGVAFSASAQDVARLRYDDVARYVVASKPEYVAMLGLPRPLAFAADPPFGWRGHTLPMTEFLCQCQRENDFIALAAILPRAFSNACYLGQLHVARYLWRWVQEALPAAKHILAIEQALARAAYWNKLLIVEWICEVTDREELLWRHAMSQLVDDLRQYKYISNSQPYDCARIRQVLLPDEPVGVIKEP